MAQHDCSEHTCSVLSSLLPWLWRMHWCTGAEVVQKRCRSAVLAVSAVFVWCFVSFCFLYFVSFCAFASSLGFMQQRYSFLTFYRNI